MNFELSEDHKLIKQYVRDFAEAEIAPTTAERDRKSECPTEIIKKCGEMGYFGMFIPEEYGGAGMDYLSYVLAIEEFARVDASVAVILSVTNSLAAYSIFKFGNEDQKQKFLVPLASGKKLGGYMLTEAGAGSDAGSLRATAILKGDNYVINGSKMFITSGLMADTFIVFAKTDPEAKSGRGISAFVVDAKAKGLSVSKKENKLGIRSSDTCEMVFEDCEIPKENLLGEEGDGFKMALHILDGGRVGISAQANGISTAALENAIKYANERKQFNRTIGSFQAIQFKLADMATKLEAARLLMIQAAWKKQNEMKCTKECAMSKVFSSESCTWITNQAVQIFGGYGYMNEYPVERLMRDAKITELYEGTSEVQRIVISRNIMK
ncbi:MAG: acyl-CoA dehydrogenase [Calditrichaeota bacterium]|nr:MAG: acyl-CoA dehydrogenase [Calditrichota bacterium]